MEMRQSMAGRNDIQDSYDQLYAMVSNEHKRFFKRRDVIRPLTFAKSGMYIASN